MLAALWNTLFFFVAIGILITVHEYGHYLAARLCGVRVYRFSLGFGPVLFRKTLKNGTEFALSLLPLGGYVKMKGEGDDVNTLQGGSEDDAAAGSAAKAGAGAAAGAGATGAGAAPVKAIETDFAELRVGDAAEAVAAGSFAPGAGGALEDSDSFASKKIWQRAVIIGAGPAANMLLAVLLYTIINMMGVKQLYPVVDQIVPFSLAEEAGLKDYDLIRRFNGVEVSSWSDVTTELLVNAGNKVSLVVAGDLGQGPERVVTLDLGAIELSPQSSPFEALGFAQCIGKMPEGIQIVEDGSSAQAAGMQQGDIITHVDGVETPNWTHAYYYIKKHNEEALVQGTLTPICFTVLRNGSELEFQILPEMKFNPVLEKEVPMVGVGMMVKPLPELFWVRQYGPLEGLVQAVKDTGRMSLVILDTTSKLISGVISPRNVSGPIGIAKVAGDAAGFGLLPFLGFLGLLSVNLGVLNLLPVPVLDGGQLMYLCYEKVRGRKPDEKVQWVLTLVGLTLILSLTILAIFNDLATL